MKNFILLSVSAIVCVCIMESALSLYEKYIHYAEYNPSGDVINLQNLNYNDSEISKTKPDAEFRILSFGDSFCHATVSPAYSYNGILQSRLQEKGVAARVVNLGEPISSIPQYLATMNNWMPQIDHDMVLINIFAVNDLGELSRDELQDDGYLNRILGDLFVDVQTGRKRLDHVPHMFPLRVLDYLHTLYSYFRDGAFVHRSVPPPYTLAHGPVSPEVFVRVVANDLAICALESRDSHGPALDRVAQLARVLSDLKARGKRVLITISPGEVQINPTLFHEAVARQNADPANYDLDLPNTMVRETIQAVDPSLEVFDLTPLLREAMARGNNPYYPSDAHWNVDGNRIVGEALAERIGRP